MENGHFEFVDWKKVMFNSYHLVLRGYAKIDCRKAFFATLTSFAVEFPLHNNAI